MEKEKQREAICESADKKRKKKKTRSKKYKKNVKSNTVRERKDSSRIEWQNLL